MRNYSWVWAPHQTGRFMSANALLTCKLLLCYSGQEARLDSEEDFEQTLALDNQMKLHV